MKDNFQLTPIAYTPGPNSVFFTDLLRYGYSPCHGGCDPASLAFAARYIRREKLVFFSPNVLRAYYEDCGSGRYSWNYEELFQKRFPVNHPFYFIELNSAPVSKLRGGCLIEIFDRCEFSLDVLEDDGQRQRFLNAARLILEEKNARHPEMMKFTPFVRWELTVENLLLTRRIHITARPEPHTGPFDDNADFYHPGWIMGALLDYCPIKIERIARITAFQYRPARGHNKINSPQWFLMFGEGGRPVSRILHQPFDFLDPTPEAFSAYSGTELCARSEFLLPALFSWTAIQDEPPALVTGSLPNVVSGMRLVKSIRRAQPSSFPLLNEKIN
jgi:hypothetical protein